MDSTKSILTVCIPAYNASKYIEETLDSVVQQKTDFPFDVLVSDDCSTDNTLSICQGYAAKYPNIQVIQQEKNIGMAPNQHFVLSTPKTKYLAYLDSDDIYATTNFLQKQVSFLQEHEEVSVVFSNVEIFSNVGVARRKFGDQKPLKIFDLHSFLQNGIPITNSSMVVRRDAQDNVPEFFTDFFQYDWLIHIYHGLSGKFGYNDFVGTRYRLHEENATRKSTEKIFRDGIRSVPRLREVIPEEYKHYFRHSVKDMNRLAFFYLKRAKVAKFFYWYARWLSVVPRRMFSVREQARNFRDVFRIAR